MKQDKTTAMHEQIESRGYRVWVGETDRIASFHPVEGYREEQFCYHEYFIKYLRDLQARGFRFQ